MKDLLVSAARQVAIFAGGGGVIVRRWPSRGLRHCQDLPRARPHHGPRGHGALRRRSLRPRHHHRLNGGSGPSPERAAAGGQGHEFLEWGRGDAAAATAARAALKTRLGARRVPVLGVTGTGGSGKSSLVDELVRRFLDAYPNLRLGIVAVDPTKRRTGGALLGDRIRMNAIYDPRVQMRSLATRKAHAALSEAVGDTVLVQQAAGADLVIVETAGIGQSDSQVTEVSDLSLYVMTPEYGARASREDRHARFRRSRGDQQIRQARAEDRCATQAVAPRQRPSTSPGQLPATRR